MTQPPDRCCGARFSPALELPHFEARGTFPSTQIVTTSPPVSAKRGNLVKFSPVVCFHRDRRMHLHF